MNILGKIIYVNCGERYKDMIDHGLNFTAA